MSRAARVAGPGCMVLFGIPFLAAGLGVLWWGIGLWQEYRASASWPRVDVTITSVEFETHTDSDDGDTYSVACTYRYELGGRSYTGDRVSIMPGSTSEYDTHHARYVLLKEHRDAERPFSAYVNPDAPADTILFREPDVFMYAMIPFGLVFALAGLGVMGGGVYTLARTHRRAELTREVGDKPWLFREDWRQFRVAASTKKDLAIAWALGLGMSLFMSVFVVAMADAPWFVVLFVGMFLLGGAVLVVRAVLMSISLAVHGSPELVLNELPVRLGGRLVAVVRTRRSSVDASGITLALRCVETHSDGDSSTQKTVFEQDFSPAQDAVEEDGRTLVPVVVDVPAAPGPTLATSPPRRWLLAFKARAWPLALKTTFELPVFDVAEAEVTRRGG